MAALAWAALMPGRATADVYTPATIAVQIVGQRTVGKELTVILTGTAPPGLAVWAFVDPQGEACRPTASAQPPRAVVIAAGVAVGERFSFGGTYRPDHTGPDSVCAYLGPTVDIPFASATGSRDVLAAPLPEKVARRTVKLALRRHGFAKRVVEALEERCRRRGRSEFACRFEASFRGYELAGRGRVRRLDSTLTYKFKVRAQGERFVLTERNEGELP